MSGRRLLDLHGSSEIGRWLAALEDSRARTLELVQQMSDADLDRGEPNTIGSVLYHVAAIEADWLFDDICGTPELISAERFPYEVRETDGVLTPVRGETIARHLERLNATRREFIERLGAFELDTFLRPNIRAAYDVSPAYVLYHLTQHEAEHRSEIGRALGLRDLR